MSQATPMGGRSSHAGIMAAEGEVNLSALNYPQQSIKGEDMLFTSSFNKIGLTGVEGDKSIISAASNFDLGMSQDEISLNKNSMLKTYDEPLKGQSVLKNPLQKSQFQPKTKMLGNNIKAEDVECDISLASS